MEKVPKFIREFSKRESPEERKTVAREIRAKRTEHFSEKERAEGRREFLDSEVEHRAEAVQEQLRLIDCLKSELEGLNSSKLRQIFEYFKIKKLRADIDRGSRTYEQLLREKGRAISEKDFFDLQLGKEDSTGKLEEAKSILKDFYYHQKEKWVDGEYSKEEIAEYFTEDHLSSLSLEDYILLLKRFPGNVVTHVTRQGIRDHTGHGEHTAGVGQYNDGFMQILERGRLQSALGIYLAEGLKEAAVDDFLNKKLTHGLKDLGSKEKALEWLRDFVATTSEERSQPGVSGTYGDKAAVHFATEEVADDYYGSERGNEIFFVFPSAYIASQYYFSGNLAEHSGGTWNDQWVWANELRGVDIDTGLVFIPEDAMVDSVSGSRYKLDKDKKPIINEGNISLIRQLCDSPQFEEFAQDFIKESNLASKFPQSWKEKIESYRSLLSSTFGINDKTLQDAILTISSVHELLANKKHNVDIEGAAKDVLDRAGILYRGADNCTSSKDFWENYFQLHPEQRPSKIIYYKGGDPTKAIRQWREDNGIMKKTKAHSISFSEHHRDMFSTEATPGMARFRSLALKIIDEYFK